MAEFKAFWVALVFELAFVVDFVALAFVCEVEAFVVLAFIVAKFVPKFKVFLKNEIYFNFW